MLSLFACSSEEHVNDLHQYVAALKKALIKPKKNDYISTIKFPLPVAFQSVGKQRDPFVEEIASYSGTATTNPMLAFPVKAFEFVGTITHGTQVWAILKAPDNKVYQFTLKDRIGNQYGRIVSIHSDRVEVEEAGAGQDANLPSQDNNRRIVILQLKGGN